MARQNDRLVDQALNEAHQLAVARQNYQLDIPHLWASLIQPDHLAADFYQGLGVNPDRLRAIVDQELDKLPRFEQSDSSLYGKTYSQRLKRLLDRAEQYQREFADERLTVEHLILALNQQASNPITIFLRAQLVNEDRLMVALNKSKPSSNNQTDNGPKYLQELQADSDLPVIGRQSELTDLIRVLNRQTKNNALLVGPPGVGKRTIIRDLIKHLDQTKATKIYRLDLGQLVAGTKYRGEFEERFTKLLNNLQELDEKIILYVDDLPGLTTIGQADGAISAAEMLKPILEAGAIQLITSMTHAEFRENLDPDPALARHFQRITIEEPNEREVTEILAVWEDRFAAYHGVSYQWDCIRVAINLSNRYLSERALPDKALDLLDEAGAMQGNDGSQKVTPDDLAYIVERHTGVKVRGVMATERDHLLNLVPMLHAKIIGQDEAVEKVANAIIRSRAGIQNPQRPIGSFLFLGPTGVGKTALAKRLAEVLYGDQNEMIRIDMSEYMEKHAVARLVGPPPGYVGYEEGGQLTEAVRQRMSAVILLDEIEKAHPDVFNLLLQLLYEGRLTDAKGRTIDFKNTILIMTSNLGSTKILESLEENGELVSSTRNSVLEDLKHQFRPEFLNRIDDIILFNPLTSTDAEQIVKLMLAELTERLQNQHVNLEFDPAVVTYLAHVGFDPVFGARPLQRTIVQMIETPLAKKIIRQTRDSSSTYYITQDQSGFIINQK